MFHLKKESLYYVHSLCLYFWLKSLILQAGYVPQDQMNTSVIQDISADTLENKLLMISDIHVAIHSTEFIV